MRMFLWKYLRKLIILMMAAEKAIKEQCSKQGIKRPCDVEELYLPKCNITEAPDLERFKNLKRLWMNENKLYNLSGLKRNYHLTELYLQHNIITDINDTIQQLTCLQVLLLHGNQLTKLTDVVHELRNMQDLKVLNLFGNPLAQDYDYRTYVIFSIKSLELLDRKAISKDERELSLKKYDVERQIVRDSVAFCRRSDHADTNQACVRGAQFNPLLNSKRVRYEADSISGIPQNDNSQEDEQLEANKATGSKTGGKRGIMQLNRFGWIDILDARSKSKDEPVKPCIYTTKFR